VVAAFMAALAKCLHGAVLSGRLLQWLHTLVGKPGAVSAIEQRVTRIVRAAFDEVYHTCDIPAFLRKQAD
ncbi:MAG: hypothetical protein H7345_16455, partial [Rubritepida sp.]|nr:hypothetical protein [Rubritepida sp.]